MRYFPVLISSILFLFFGCEKEKINNNQRTIVTGKLTDAYTKKPIKNGNVRLYNSALEYGSPISKLDSVYTDTQGEFELDFNAEDNTKYWLEISHSDYIMTVKCPSLGPGEFEILDFQIWPNGYLKFHVKNINPVDSEDKVWVGFGYGQDYFFTGHGTSIDTTLIIPVISNVKYILNCFSEKNNHLYDHGDQIYGPPCDTLYYNIYY
ncbi:MAG: hypothetical protein WCM76_12730 [Bacteroidota bacterium]